MRKRLSNLLVLFVCACTAVSLSLPLAMADDLKGLKLPAYRDKDGYGLGITEYSLQTEANILAGEKPEHSLELEGLLQAPKGMDVLCFSSTLLVESVEDARGKDLLLPQRRKKKNSEFRALVPSLKYKDRRGEPLSLCLAELDSVELDRPGTEVAELVVTARAVVVKKRASEQISAEVSATYHDVGYGTSVQVSSIEADKGEMTVKLSVKHTGNKDLPVIDSVFALDSRGKKMGGGRWSNDLELFGKRYEVELVFPLTGNAKSIDQFQVVLATEFEVEEIEFTIEDLFSR